MSQSIPTGYIPPGQPLGNFLSELIPTTWAICLVQFPALGQKMMVEEGKIFPSSKKLLLKPDFHSRFSLVTSEIFRMGHAQSDETNRTGRKISFALFASEVQIFQLLRNFLTAKPISLLSWVTWTFHENRKIFTKWSPCSFIRPKRR